VCGTAPCEPTEIRELEGVDAEVKMNKTLALGMVAALAVGAIGLTGCGSNAASTGGSTASTATAEPSGALTVAGSDTMVNMAQAWKDAYEAANSGVTIAVKGGGSGTGIAALINGTVDFADSSREMKPEEITQAQAKGFTPVGTKVARDGVAIVVNPANKVENLTKDQLGKIYLGTIKNWKEVGGADAPITLVSRDPSSGTYEFMTTAVLAGGKFATSTKLLASTQAVVDEVTADPNAIGYIGVGYESTAIKVIGVDGIKASVETVTDETYPLWRYLYMYSKGEPTGAAKTYLTWILDAEGQQVVADEGFVPVK
jgi:phosphate transport system substrate-binding protein